MASQDNSLLSDNVRARYTWLGRFQLQSIVAQFLVENASPDTSITSLKESHSRLLSRDLMFPDVCRYLSLRYTFPKCDCSAKEELYLFLGKTAGESPAAKMADVQATLLTYLEKLLLLYLRSGNDPRKGASGLGEGLASVTKRSRLSVPVGTGTETVTATAIANPGVGKGELYSASPQPSGQYSMDATAVLAAASTGAAAFSLADGSSVLMGTSTSVAQYTVQLKERGDREGVVPVYKEKMQQEYPPLWQVDATYRSTVGTGRAKSKKEAKHLASRDVLAKLGYL
ncbi:hypothetical protein MPDQ_002322 [Monascus purpureus]|uniref:DRBM domain-containing protein n=1 Tax=Monascus purpureus TaxID=5098 RepID=A0A507QKR3_MONPU|nr:hypothetical protein MPDQ_002322 [Monascus purpureus]